jgi:hypothetical protein
MLTVESVGEWIANTIRPFAHALSSSDEELLAFVANLGWLLPQAPPALKELGQACTMMEGSLLDLLEARWRLQEGSAEESEVATAAADLLVDLVALAAQLHQLPEALRRELPADFVLRTRVAEEFEERLFDYLLVGLLRQQSVAYHAAAFLGWIESEPQLADPAVHQPEFVRHRVYWDRLALLFRNPAELSRQVYGWGTPVLEAEKLFDALLRLSFVLDMPAELHYPPIEFVQAVATGAAIPEDTGPEPQLWVPLAWSEEQAVFLAAYALPKLTPAELQGLVLTLVLLGGVEEEFALSPGLKLVLHGAGAVGSGAALVFRPDRPASVILDVLQAAQRMAQGRITVHFYSEGEEPATLLAAGGGSRIEARALFLGGGIEVSAGGAPDAFLELGLKSGKILVQPGQEDGFLSSLAPLNGFEAAFDLALRWSEGRGLHFSGSASLETEFSVHETVGRLKLETLRVALAPSAQGLSLAISLDGSFPAGPLNASLHGIGMVGEVRFQAGNLGPVDLALGFKPPTGIGLSIDGGGFQGGGFLRFVEAEQRYEGRLELEYQDKIVLKALGLLTTRMPDGKPGYSLLIIITAEFTPVQLGLGFTLNAVGGLLGLNRTANVERLRTGLRDATLNSVLFPQNVIANASRILSDLTQVFPPQANRFLFGPMARIGWGTPTLLTIDLGLLIEIPDPVRMLVLGVVKATLPDENAKLLQLQINFLGVIDFEAQRLAFDASLYESKLLTYPLSGDMAVRLSWGAEPNLLLTAGGFHPAYEPPPLNLPTLRRLSLQLTAGDNPRLRLETYFAITSNTVQFGAKAELLAKAGSFNVYGLLSFDVLFQFNPFYFIASISAKLALRAGSSEIASISLDFTLEGPTPWHAKGTAKLKICWFLTIKVRFDKTFGEERNTRLDDVPVLPLLKAALSSLGNWEANLPGNRHLLVTLKQIETTGDQLVVYPFGILTIQQKVVPLNIEIQKFGSQRPTDGDHFAIEQVRAGEVGNTEVLATSDVREMFAPAQFFDLSDAQKLASKSFERYDSGVKLVDSEAFAGDYAVRRGVAYELFYIDEQRNLLRQPEFQLPDFLAFDQWATLGAIANSPLSHARRGPSALAPGAVQVSQEAYAVVNASDLRLAAADTLAASEGAAQALMERMIRGNSALEGEILVVPAFEVNQS